MRRDQLEHAIRASCQIIQHGEVIVVGSQAILGTYDESQLPPAATMSLEVDILPIADTNQETAKLADLIEGVAGEFSTFEELHGFSIDGVDLDTAVLPEAGRSAWSRSRTRTPLRLPARHASQAGAWTRRTSAWRSCVRSGRRTETSSLRFSMPTSSMPTPSPPASIWWHPAGSPRPGLFGPGSTHAAPHEAQYGSWPHESE